MSYGQNNRVNPDLERIEKARNTSFKVGIYHQPYFKRGWHYHPEYELMLITKGFGMRLVGDHSESFQEGDLVLLGSHLPHAWISDSSFLNSEGDTYCESIFIQFDGTIFNSLFFELPEFKEVKSIVGKASRGVKIVGNEKIEIGDLIRHLPNLSPIDRVLKIIHILAYMENSRHEKLASHKFINEQIYYKSGRMQRVQQFVMDHYKQQIGIEDAARLINMTKSSFCRFFRNQTKNTFTRYLNSIRIDFAKKLLANTNTPIKEVGYECGFESISYFNQVFKQIVGHSPKQYRGVKP